MTFFPAWAAGWKEYTYDTPMLSERRALFQVPHEFEKFDRLPHTIGDMIVSFGGTLRIEGESHSYPFAVPFPDRGFRKEFGVFLCKRLGDLAVMYRYGNI